ARGAAAQRACSDRPRLLGRHVAERDRRLPRHPARNGEDEDAERPRAAGRAARGGARMTGPPDFRNLLGDDVPEEEFERLRRVHELLVAAGPPPELSPSLGRPPEIGGRLLSLPRRRRSALLLIAAALVAGLFGVGFLVGSLQNPEFPT